MWMTRPMMRKEGFDLIIAGNGSGSDSVVLLSLFPSFVSHCNNRIASLINTRIAPFRIDWSVSMSSSVALVLLDDSCVVDVDCWKF